MQALQPDDDEELDGALPPLLEEGQGGGGASWNDTMSQGTSVA